MLQAGDMAPDFELPVLIGGVRNQFRLSEHRGKQNLVLAFYPMNWDPVSAQQMIGYQVEREKFLARGAEVVAISVDHIMNTTSWEREIGPFDFSDVQRFLAARRGQPAVRSAAANGTLRGSQRARCFCRRQSWTNRVQQDLSRQSASRSRGNAGRVAAKIGLRTKNCPGCMQQEPDEIYLYPHPCGGFLHRYFSFFQPEWNIAIRRALPAMRSSIFGFRNSSDEMAREIRFMVVPDPKLAEEHLRILTQAPHMAGTPEDKATADYVAQKFREAGLETEIVEYRVWMNYPAEISVDVTAPAGVTMHGPTRERVSDDPYQDDPRVVMPFNSMSPSGDVEAEVVYANYGSPEDFQKLEQMKIDVRGKIVLVRYGQNFRGVKAFVAQEHGAAGVLIYSDPADDGWRHGDKYPQGPWRPDTGVQRGSVGYMFQFPGDPTTPGIASVPILARFQTHASGTVSAVAKDSQHAALVRRCLAHPRTPGRSGLSTRLARLVALYLSRWAGAGESEDASQAGLSAAHDLGRNRPRARQRDA